MRWLKPLYVQVLVGMVLGILLGVLWPEIGAAMKPFADAFIKLVKMMLAPVIFGTVALGIARMANLKEVGRIGARALIYFEIASTLALTIGLVVVNLVKPGVGMNVDVASLDASSIETYAAVAHDNSLTGFLLDIIPNAFLGAFVEGKMLQVVLLAVLGGVALTQMGERAKPLLDGADRAMEMLFKIVAMVMRLAPIGAGAGIAFTVGQYGLDSLLSLGRLLIALYVTTGLFIVVVLGGVLRWAGFPLLKFLRYFREEILVVLGTCSTEAVLPRMVEKLERMGVEKTVVGLVLPAGYTFNADGTCIYLTMGAIFVAQATNTPLDLMDQLLILGLLLLTSKGSAGVAGAGFIALASTLSSVGTVPLVGLVLLLGVDRFLNEARAVTNLIGNAVATVAVAKWEGALDKDRADAALNGEPAAAVAP
ncbi:C4-dicarboxylate transporter DctA [Brevundimonas sp. SL161]|uniref:C4-dicarboxylate transporter DctA n=1 Tax=Brevundimonas sp. SL161 TaxID=2804613 RepID=UPI003CEA6020